MCHIIFSESRRLAVDAGGTVGTYVQDKSADNGCTDRDTGRQEEVAAMLVVAYENAQYALSLPYIKL